MTTQLPQRATRQDIPGIEALIEKNPESILARKRDELEELIESFWVIRKDGKVVGCVCLEVYSQKIAELRTLAVDESCQGLGYGKLLVEAATGEAERRGIRQVITVTSIPKFFEQLDFGPCLNEKYALFWKGKVA